jgi:hypothetical protein
MRNDLTVIYYTSNRERPEFEAKIRTSLLEVIGDLPLISVSQKPLDFGENICVGDVGVSTHNVFRQFQVGAKAAKTKFVIAAEADCLYPKEYFEFVPEKDDTLYTPFPAFVLFAMRGSRKLYARRTNFSDFGSTGYREHIISRVNRQLGGRKWRPKDGVILHFGRIGKHEEFKVPIPPIAFKTDSGMHTKTPHVRKDKVYELPFWGKSHALIGRYCG